MKRWITDQQGKKIVDQYGADIIVELDSEYMSLPSFHPPHAIVKLDPPVYDHERNGFFLVNGPGIKAMKVDASILDITPTALYTLRQNLPKDLDGRVITEIFSPEYLQKNPLIEEDITTDREISSDQADQETSPEVLDFLKSLGYTQ